MSHESHQHSKMLVEVASKALPQPLHADRRLLAYCPTMDLIALATIDNHVHVFRLNGQRVFGVSPPQSQPAAASSLGSSKSILAALEWKPNGRTLAVAYTNGVVTLINSYTGKSAYHLSLAAPSEPSATVCALGWGVNLLEACSVRSRIGKQADDSRAGKRGGLNLDEILARGGLAAVAAAGESGEGVMDSDLPADLAAMEVEVSLPKLATLPAGGKEDDVFASRASIDALFHASRKDTNELADVLVVCFEDGSIHLSIYDIFEIGRFEQVSPHRNSRVVYHCSHPYFSTHTLLLANGSENPEYLVFVPMDLRLITDSRRSLALLASKSTQLQNMLRYMHDTQAQIYIEFASSQDLPGKFIRNIDETLQEKDYSTFMTAVYHLVATGDCSASMKEWLTDELGERGHKRWEKAATSGYENLSRFTLQNLLPALDRFGVVVSRLRGLAKYHEATSAFGLETVELDRILDTLSCLFLLAHNVLIQAGEELHQFSAFSKWMKLEIETQVADPGATVSDDVADKYSELDYEEIFDYIQGAMQRSTLHNLFNLQPASDERSVWEMPPDNETMYNDYKILLDDIRHEEKLPGLALMLARLDRQCKIVFRRIAETQKRKVRFGSPIRVASGNIGCFDARTLDEEILDNKMGRYATYIATVKKASTLVTITRILLNVVNGMSSTESVESAGIILPNGSKIQDIKFSDDKTLLVALKLESFSFLVYLPYRNQNSTEAGLAYSNTNGGASLDGGAIALDISRNDEFESYIRHAFENETGLAAETLAVNGRKGRRAVCIAAEDRIHYRVYDLDSHQDDGEDEDDAVEPMEE